MPMNVVVVESPAKAKTINKYLGSDYTVLASFGHVRDLPPKDGSVKPDEDFAMAWEVDTQSAKRVKAIADAVKEADRLILATDPEPSPISNKRFASALAKALNRPSFAAMPSWVLTTLLGDLGREIFLADQTVHPTKLKDYGYVYLDPNLESVFQPFSTEPPERLRLTAQPATARE